MVLKRLSLLGRGADGATLSRMESVRDRDSQPGSKTFEGLMSSPWKVSHAVLFYVMHLCATAVLLLAELV